MIGAFLSVEVLGTARGIFRHLGMRQLADRIGKQRRAAIVAELHHVALGVALRRALLDLCWLMERFLFYTN